MLHFARMDAAGERIQWEDPAKVQKDKRSHAGKRIEVVIRKRRSQRSLDQNAYIHAVPVPLLAEYCGYSIAEMKFELMGACWGWKTLASGREVPVIIHTSDMDTEQCSHFIDWVVPFGASYGVIIPLPNEVDYSRINDPEAA